MKNRVELTRDASNYLRRLDKPTQSRIRQRLHKLGENPFAVSKSLAGTHIRSSRVGDFRILFEIHEGRLVVLVLAIGPCGQIYREL